jgi:hypothetical protein
VWWEDILLDERAGAVQPIVAQALEYIPAVVYELQRHSRVPNEWGRLWPSEQISLRWRQLKADDDTDGQTSKGLGTREPWAWLEYELRAVVVAYYGNKPARIARLAKPGPDGRPFEGPALTVIAVNAALSVKRPSKPEEHQEMPSRLPDGEVAWAKKYGKWGPQPQLVAPPLIVPRWEDFSVTQEYLAELEVPERDRETLLVWMSACKSAPDGKVDWDILATAFGVGSAWIHRLNSCCGVGRGTRMPC